MVVYIPPQVHYKIQLCGILLVGDRLPTWIKFQVLELERRRLVITCEPATHDNNNYYCEGGRGKPFSKCASLSLTTATYDFYDCDRHCHLAWAVGLANLVITATVALAAARTAIIVATTTTAPLKLCPAVPRPASASRLAAACTRSRDGDRSLRRGVIHRSLLMRRTFLSFLFHFYVVSSSVFTIFSRIRSHSHSPFRTLDVPPFARNSVRRDDRFIRFLINNV